MYIYDHKLFKLPNQSGERSEPATVPSAWPWVSRKTGLGPCLTTIDLGQTADLPRVASARFANRGKTHPDNCASVCRNGPCKLGVGVDGTGANSMELQFTVPNHREGIEYDVKRTRCNSLWERRNGVWTCLESVPTGTPDDHNNDDECRTPKRNRIFVIDRPGFPRTRFPALAGHIFTTAPGVYTHADATEVVARTSFDEWVNAGNPSEGIDWTPIGPDPHIFWHNIIWMVRNANNEWILDKARSRIELGKV
jgi:hypothetical protein